jgi:hypothetical protein
MEEKPIPDPLPPVPLLYCYKCGAMYYAYEHEISYHTYCCASK